MAGLNPLNQNTREKNKKKRKLTAFNGENQEEEYPPTKSARIQESDEKRVTEIPIFDAPWRNLQLILSLQNKEFDIQRKVEIAYAYVKSKGNDEANDTGQDLETVSVSRVVVFLNNWVQSLLISSEKKARVGGKNIDFGSPASCLDCRCWEILRFCLEESLELHVSLVFSRDFLRVIHCIAGVVLSQLNGASSSIQVEGLVSEHADLEGYVLQFYTTMLGCISCIFILHGGVSNENLELWMLTVEVVLKLVQKVLDGRRHNDKMGIFVQQYSVVVIEPFTRFLRVHPVRKNGFHEFVDKILEPVMRLLDSLHPFVHSENSGQTGLLLKLLEDLLSQGLFHPIHIDGFLNLQCLSKYKASDDGKVKDLKAPVKSYHRHLFDKLEKIISGVNSLALGGLGDLFRLYVDSAKKKKGISVGGDGSEQLEDDFTGQTFKGSSNIDSVVAEKNHYVGGLNSETRKSVFEFFVQIMEPLMIEINSFLQDEWEVGPMLSNAHWAIKSLNKILFSFVHGNVYVRIEDSTEGACVNFLKAIYDMIMTFSSKIIHTVSSVFDSDEQAHKEVIILIAKELIVGIKWLLEIEYEVLGNELEKLWLMMISIGAFGLIRMDVTEHSSLTLEIIHLGSQIINLYSELRQVDISVFALCKAVRHLLLSGSDQMSYSSNTPCRPSLHYESCVQFVGLLLCSQEFRLSNYNATKSIPEGQVSAFLRQLTADISDSLSWIKHNCSIDCRIKPGKLDLDGCSSPYFILQTEALGRGLSDLYTLILESVTVTMGNSIVIGDSMKDLIKVIRANMQSLVGLHTDGVYGFVSTVTGRITTIKDGGKQKCRSIYWIVLFFFRLYMASRSLYRQVVSLVPPVKSKEMSEEMGDSFTAYPGKDWLERTCGVEEGYFSWIVKPSASLLTTIEEILSVCVQDAVADCSSLVYVLNSMALQRLVDLNRLIKSFEYRLQMDDIVITTEVTDDAGQQRKKCKELKRNVSDLKQEAAELSTFLLGYVSLLNRDQLSSSSPGGDIYGEPSGPSLPKSGEWDFSVASVNENSLPTAIWWILCQNIDVWCGHATKKKLKMFLSLLIQNFLYNLEGSFSASGKNGILKHGHLKTVTVHKISSAFLSNIVFYEQRFVRRHMASRVCKILEKLGSSIFREFGKIHLNVAPDWPDVLGSLEKSLIAISDNSNGAHEHFLATEQNPNSSNKPHSVNFAIRTCQSLLKFLSWMPKGYISSRSFSSYAACILNLERLSVGCLIDCRGTLNSHDLFQLFRLFLSCRMALKSLQVEYGEENVEPCQFSTATNLKGPFPTLWLFKSLSTVIEVQHTFPDGSATQAKENFLSLMDHTSHIFWTFSKDQFMRVMNLLMPSVKSSKENVDLSITGGDDKIEDDTCSDTYKDLDSWKDIIVVAETLRDQTHRLLLDFKEGLCCGSLDVCANGLELKKLSSIISCFQGLLWGLASAMDQIVGEGCNLKSTLSRRRIEPLFRLNLCIDTFAEFICYFLNFLFLEGDNFPDTQDLCMSEGRDDLFGAKESSEKGVGFADMLTEKEQPNCQNAKNCLSSKSNGGSYRSTWKTKLGKKKEDVPSFLAMVDLFERQKLKKSLLLGCLRGENPEAAFFLRQLFITYSAMLKINLHIKKKSLPAQLIPIFIGISEVLLLEYANMDEFPEPICFVLLDGVAKFLEALGSWFPLTVATSTEKAYMKLINLHLMALGKCISLQGKRASLTSHETESSAKTLSGQMKLSESTTSFGQCCLHEFKARLRMSFEVYVKNPSEYHLLSAVQSLERALVGVQQGCSTNYEICTGTSGGGKVSSTVAAGIDFLDLVLKNVKGSKRLSSVVKSYVQNLVASLFNIILHLQGVNMFRANTLPNRSDANPDPGSVILMSIEVLTRVFGKHALYQTNACHVSQSLHIPAVLFQNVLHLRISEARAQPDSSSVFDINDSVVDRQFIIELYAACCGLLCSVIRHHKREVNRCLAVLQGAVSVLLSCLEMVDVDPAVKKDFFSWRVQEGVKCAYFLRRIYEEIRQQKKYFRRHAFQFLSNYIRVYSRLGPLKMGIRREIDEALRPGIYALIDVCSPEDLQHIYTVFGEGPCRSTLATLQHDYKLNFQYEGKV